MIKKIALMAGLFALAISVTVGPGLQVRAVSAATNPLVISAVQTTGGEGKTAEDYVELYNPNSEPFNLNGYRLVKRSENGTADASVKSWSSDTFIPAYSFYLWANAGFTGISSAPDATTSSTLADNNGVALRFGANDVGSLVDSLSWGTTNNGFGSTGLTNPVAGQSIVRNSLFQNSGYSLSPSQPRNSTKQVLPGNSEIPESPQISTNNAVCEIVDSAQELSNAQINKVAFTNTGDTTWTGTGYIVDGTNSDDFVLTGTQSIAPGATLSLDLEIPVPTIGGKQTYEWQMSQGAVKFGQRCTLELAFKTPTEQPQPDQAPEQEPEQPEEETPEVPSEQPTPEIPGNDNSINITELLINPEGKDDGQEKIELYNGSDSKINLTDWIIDDINAGAPLTSDKYVLSNLEINPKSYLVITLPAGKSVLNNTTGDVVSLINKTGEFIDTVQYITASSPEGKTLSLIDQEWQWTTASLGSINIAPIETPEQEQEEETEQPTNVDVDDLKISEIYAAPAKGEVEFLELFNGGDKTINLANVTLQIGDKSKTLPEVNLLPGKYIALKDDQLALTLLDKGASVKLLEKGGSKIFEVTYDKAVKGQSYAEIDGKFVWTTTPTPNLANKFTVPDPITKGKTVITKKTTTTTKTTPTKTTTTKKTVVKKTTSNAPAKIKANSSLPKDSTLISTNNVSEAEPVNQTGSKAGNKNVNIVAMVVASLGAGSFAVYKFGFGGF